MQSVVLRYSQHIATYTYFAVAIRNTKSYISIKLNNSIMTEVDYAYDEFSSVQRSQHYRPVSSSRSMYSAQFNSRLKKIQLIREERSKAIENDICASRAQRTCLVFPSTCHMDISRGPARGFDCFRHANKLPPNCITHQKRTSVKQSSSYKTRNSDIESLVVMHNAPPQLSQRMMDGDSVSVGGYWSELSEPVHVNRVLYPPSPASFSAAPEAVKPSPPSSHKVKSVQQSSYHLILDTRICFLSGSLDILHNRVGLLAITSSTNKIDLSLAARDQLSLEGVPFTVKIVNPSSSSKVSISFHAQFTSLDPRDLVSLHSVLCDQSRIYIQIMNSSKKEEGVQFAPDIHLASPCLQAGDISDVSSDA